MSRNDIFVSTAWLAEHLGREDIVVVDGSYYLATMNRDAAAEFSAGRIPGAVRFDIDTVKDPHSSLPHMLPTPEAFAAAVGAMGIGDGMTVVVYDGMGLFAAPRVRWTFKAFGAETVHILDGGLPHWKAEGRALESGAPAPRAARVFTPRFDPAVVAGLADIRRVLADGSAQVVDARPADRFAGTAPEPRPGLPSGHMPGAFNVPFSTLVADGKLKDEAGLRAALEAGGVDLTKPIITSCGSGVSAAIVSTALELIGKPAAALYDGAWVEWASQPDTQIVSDERQG